MDPFAATVSGIISSSQPLDEGESTSALTSSGMPTSTDDTSQSTQQDHRIPIQCLSGRQVCSRRRRLRSKGAVLVIVWTGIVNAAFISTIHITEHNLSKRVGDTNGLLSLGLSVTISALSSPIAGWVADVYIGRSKMIRSSIWLMWLGSGVMVISQLRESPLFNLIKVIAECLVSAGFGAYLAIALPFGLDQMLGASGEEISAFIHWCVWGTFGIGKGIAILGQGLHDCNISSIAEPFIPVSLLTVAICCDFLFSKSLLIQPESKNPFKLVCGVLRYAASHSRPKRVVSALLLCQEERPTRIDFAKTSYGGPYTYEQVEDVKTCLRMLGIIAAASALLLPLYIYNFSLRYLRNHFARPQFTSCQLSLLWSSYSPELVITLGIPLYELLLYPVFRNCVPSILKRLGFSGLLITFLMLIPLVADPLGHAGKSKPSCMFEEGSNATISHTYLWIDVPQSILQGLFRMLYHTASFEFICAQTPRSMEGMLFGLLYFTQLVNVSLAYWVNFAWKLGLEHSPNPLSLSLNCGFWYYLCALLLALTVEAIFCIAAKLYKRRTRDELVNVYLYAERYYSQRSTEQEHSSTDNNCCSFC